MILNKLIKMLIFLIFVLKICHIKGSDKCYALSLEGGGSHGAYEAGVIWELVNSLDPSETRYNVVSGISTGALNAAGVALFPIGQEKEMADFVVNTWMSLNSTKDIYTD